MREGGHSDFCVQFLHPEFQFPAVLCYSVGYELKTTQGKKSLKKKILKKSAVGSEEGGGGGVRYVSWNPHPISSWKIDCFPTLISPDPNKPSLFELHQVNFNQTFTTNNEVALSRN